MTDQSFVDLGTTERSDAELISAVRDGDVESYGELFGRHRDAAMRLARQLVSGPDADDLVADAFVKVLRVLSSGGGPQESFRAYLLTAVRRLHIDAFRATKRVRPTADETELDRVVDWVDPAAMTFERGAAADAFASLPERWQMVLWHLDVEGNKPADIAGLLGMSPNSVSALAYRAREGLRQAYLQQHLAPALDAVCRSTMSQLGAHVRHGLAARNAAKVEAHLDECAKCTGLFLELRDVNSDLSAILGPIVLGSAAFGYLASAGTVASAASLGAGTAAGISLSAKSMMAAAAQATAPARSAVSNGSALAPVAIATVAVVGVASAALLVTADDRPSDSDESSLIAGPNPTNTATTPGTATEPSEGDNETLGSESGRGSRGESSLEPRIEPKSGTATGSPRGPRTGLTVNPTPKPTPTPTVTPRVDPTPVSPTDFGITGVTSRSASAYLERTITASFSATTPGRAIDRTVNATITFRGGAEFRGTPSTAWSCTANPRGLSYEMMCSTRVPAGAPVPQLILQAAGILPKGSITISEPDDPNPANNSADFRSTTWLLGL